MILAFQEVSPSRGGVVTWGRNSGLHGCGKGRGEKETLKLSWTRWVWSFFFVSISAVARRDESGFGFDSWMFRNAVAAQGHKRR